MAIAGFSVPHRPLLLEDPDQLLQFDQDILCSPLRPKLPDISESSATTFGPSEGQRTEFWRGLILQDEGETILCCDAHDDAAP